MYDNSYIYDNIILTLNDTDCIQLSGLNECSATNNNLT